MSLSASTLTVEFREKISIGGKVHNFTHLQRIANIKSIYQRLFTISNAESVLYSTHASDTGGNQFDVDLVKYARITNKNSKGQLCLIIETDSSNDEAIVKLDPGATFLAYNHQDSWAFHDAAYTIGTGTQATSDFVTVGHGNANISSSQEGKEVTIVSTDGTSKTYFITDTNAGGVATGTILDTNSDIGSTIAGVSNEGKIAVGVNTTGTLAKQADLLNQLKAAVTHANGHDGKITCGADADNTASSAQTITFTQADGVGTDGNTAPTDDITDLTIPDFTSGADAGVGADAITSISAICVDADVDVEVFVASL